MLELLNAHSHISKLNLLVQKILGVKSKSFNHTNLGYWYEWIKYKDCFEKSEERQLVKCGNSLPIFWKDRKGGPLIGLLDNKTEEAGFSHDGVAENVSLFLII